jgi:hypothetical protein
LLIFRKCAGQEGSNYLLDMSTKYDLVSNICHDSPVTQGSSIVAINMNEGKPPPRNAGEKKNNAEFNVLQAGTYRIHTHNKVIPPYL